DRNLQSLFHNIAVLWRHSFYHVTTRSVSKITDINVSFRQRAVIEFLVKANNLLLIFTKDFNVLTEMPAWVPAVLGDG
ncbi:hypothetical protein L9F63_017972, partial [Diploptera punctata]